MARRNQENDVVPDQINIQKKTTTRKTTHSKHQRYREAGARVSTTQGCGDAACQGCVEALSLKKFVAKKFVNIRKSEL